MNNATVYIVLAYYSDVPTIISLVETLLPNPVIVVDNTPLNKNLDQQDFHTYISTSPSEIVYLPQTENTGYTGGVNIGLETAYKNGASWMVILNDDLTVDTQIISIFLDRLATTTPGIAGPYPRYLDTHRWTTTLTPDSLKTTPDFLSGSFLAIHRDVIEKIGYFYDPYFVFYEEVEFCVRACLHGFQLTPIELHGIIHKESSSFEELPYLHQYYLARNHLLFVERNAPFSVKAYEALRFPKTLWEHLHKKEWGALAGIRDYILRRFGPHPDSLRSK